jgi:ribonuclease J
LAASSSHLELIPLGGLGEFGMNLMLIRHGDDGVVVDAGLMFPGAEHLGVDVVIPNLEFLDECGTLHGVVLSHGHEDHVGALPWVLARHDVPVWCSPFTRGLVQGRLSEHDLADGPALRTFSPRGETLRLGPFEVETIPVSHSIPQAVMLALRTPVGTVVHTADFKLDPDPPDGVCTDLARLAEIGDEGVLALLSDSTNADRAGFTPGERTVAPALDTLIGSAERRVFVTTFSSNIHRMQQLVDLAVRHDRHVALIGASIQRQVEVAQRLDLLRMPAGRRLLVDAVMDAPPERILALVTGSQGEPMSALSRIAVERHKDVAIEDGDLVIHSARVIPGNEKSIGRMINHLMRRGARVVTAADAHVHVSGHPSREELRQLLQLVRPRWLVPVHGEYRQLHAHATLAGPDTIPAERVCLAQSGDVIAVNERECRIADRVPVGHVFIDAALDEVEVDVLRERRKIAGDGIVVPVLAVDRESGVIGGSPEIVTRGFVFDGADDPVLAEARRVVVDALADASPEERGDEGVLKARIQTELKRFLRRKTQRRPLIIPVIVEF